MKANNRIAEENIRAARAKVMQLRPYFAHAVYSYILVQLPSDCPMKTMAVDQHKRLYYNELFVTQVSVDKLVPCIIHELGHSLRDHHTRARAMGVTTVTQHIANRAQDYEINGGLRREIDSLGDMPQLPMIPASCCPDPTQGPQPPCYPEQRGFDEDEPWEYYYQQMLDDMGDRGDIQLDCGSGSHGVPMPWEVGDPTGDTVEGVSDADWEDIKHRTAEAIANHAKGRGNVPHGWLEWANDLLRPKRIPWDQELSARLRWAVADTRGMVIHSYKRPSRRSSVMPDFCLPSMRRPKPFVAMVGDTSGSMSHRDLALVRGVVDDICMAMGATVAFLSTDAAVHGGVQHVHNAQKLQLAGRGGTNMAVGIEYAVGNLRPKPDVVVVVTDCDTPWPKTKPSSRVIVAAVGDSPKIQEVPSWARLIHVDPENTSRRNVR